MARESGGGVAVMGLCSDKQCKEAGGKLMGWDAYAGESVVSTALGG